MPNKKNGKSSADYYKENPASYKLKLEKQKEINRRPEERKKRAELVKLNREYQKKNLGAKGDGKDVSHKSGGRTVLEDASKNRSSKNNTAGDRRSRATGRKNK